MIAWVSFCIALIGWLFTSRQNMRNSARTLLNQQVKEVREKLHDIIVACSSEVELPVEPNSEIYIKLQTYIETVNELDRLYTSYYSSFSFNIKFINVLFSSIDKWLLKYNLTTKIKLFFIDWFWPKDHFPLNINFELPKHIGNIRKALTLDAKERPKDERLQTLQLASKQLYLKYQFVS